MHLTFKTKTIFLTFKNNVSLTAKLKVQEMVEC